MIEVYLRNQVGGCVSVPLTIMTLGLYPFLVSMGERHFIHKMDPGGVLTRGGKNIAWSEFTRIIRRQGTMDGAVLSNEYLLESKKGRVSLPVWRAINAKEATDFLFKYLPPSISRE